MKKKKLKKEIRQLKDQNLSFEDVISALRKNKAVVEKLNDSDRWKLIHCAEILTDGVVLTGWADENEIKQFEDINGTVKPFSTGNRTITLHLYNKKWETQ